MTEFQDRDAAGQCQALAQLGATALRRYRLENPVLTPLQHQENATFAVETDDERRYVLRIGRPEFRPARSVAAETCWLAALHRDTELRVPVPVPNADGQLSTVACVPDVPQARVCTLFEWIEGEFRHAALTEAELRSVGELTAQLQLHGATFDPPEGNHRERIGLLTMAGRRSAAESSADPWRMAVDNPDDERAALDLVRTFASPHLRTVQGLLAQLAAVKRRLGLGADSFGLIHGDLHQFNYLFTPQHVAAIDFDDCGYYYHLYDLAVTISEIYLLPGGAALRAAVLDGYTGVRRLPDGHQHAIEVFIAFRLLQNALWMIELRSHPAFRDRWASSTRRLFQEIGELPGVMGRAPGQ